MHESRSIDVAKTTTRLQEQLDELEALLGHPERGYEALAHFAFRALWRACRTQLEQFSSELRRQQQDRERKRLLAEFQQDREERMRLADERLRQALTFQSLYLGLSPYDSLAIYGLLAYIEMAGGIYYPMGGMVQLPLALERLAVELGVEFRYRTPVSRLDRAGDHIRAAILQDGTRVPADVIVTNADLPYAHDQLVAEPYPGIYRKEFSCSVALLYLGVKRTYPDLLHHNLVVGSESAALPERAMGQRLPAPSRDGAP